MQSVVNLMDTALSALTPKVKLTANRGKYGGECVEYVFNTTYYNGARREARMKLHIVAATMERGLELEQLLDELLVRKDETPLTPTVTASARNGGGWLEDGDWHIRVAYYDFTIRAPRG